MPSEINVEISRRSALLPGRDHLRVSVDIPTTVMVYLVDGNADHQYIDACVKEMKQKIITDLYNRLIGFDDWTEDDV